MNTSGLFLACLEALLALVWDVLGRSWGRFGSFWPGQAKSGEVEVKLEKGYECRWGAPAGSLGEIVMLICLHFVRNV